ncbi:MAG TPA: zf-TFIIB domain-containing protein [Geobacterales bacterium]|nr:zf-TFIIB domain-containing protein [Geobacterales bacterium]
MTKTEEKMMYRIIAQTKESNHGLTLTGATGDVTYDQAIKVAQFLLSQPMDAYTNFVVQPITTKERWKAGTINYCPRCGANLHDYELSESEYFDCYECNSSLEINISVFDSDDDDRAGE